MSIRMLQLPSREKWLETRASYIGGSEAASIVGMNPWQTNVELWELKTGRVQPRDISDNPAVAYGAQAERPLRELFALDFPQYKVEYVENNLWLNSRYPFAHASLDGWITDEEGRRGVLEIKTTTITGPAQKAKWDNKIPDNYFCQVLWYMAVCELDFAVLKAKLRWVRGLDILAQVRHYRIERADVQEDIDYLMEKGAEFHRYIVEDREPPLVLPNI